VGFGDITPKSPDGKIVAMANSLVGVVSIGFLIAIVSLALQPSVPITPVEIVTIAKSPPSAREAIPDGDQMAELLVVLSAFLQERGFPRRSSISFPLPDGEFQVIMMRHGHGEILANGT
jgi:Ion channel